MTRTKPRFVLTFDPGDITGKYPHGYWYAYSETTDCEGEGPDPLTAVATLAHEMETQAQNKEN